MPQRAISNLQSETGFKILFEYATIGIVVIDKNGIIRLANPFSEKLLGYNPGELNGELLEKLIPDNFKKSHTKHHAAYFKAPKERAMGQGIDLFARHKNGSLIPVEISLGHYEMEAEIYAVTYITDISIRKKNEEALKHSEKKFRFLFDNSNDIRAFYKVIYDDKENVIDLIIEEANPLYKEVMLKSGFIGDCNGKSIREMPGDHARHFKECGEAIKSGKNTTYQYYNPATDWYMLITIIPIDRDHCFAYGINITKQKKIENELYELNRELEHRVEERTETLASVINELASSKAEVVSALEKEKELNELKSRFITTASHEFRTPLATILSSVALIDKYKETGEEPKRKKHIERIQSSVNNLIEILNDFLSLGKLEEGFIQSKPEPLQIDEFVRAVIDENRSVLKKDQAVIYKHISGHASVMVDKQILKNVILNLFSNAVKYSAEGKHIDISTKVEEGVMDLKIKDQGIGIPDKDQKFLFTRFFRAKNVINIEGTGLGLNIVKKYVDLLKGSISFKSELDVGTEFIVKIPVK